MENIISAARGISMKGNGEATNGHKSVRLPLHGEIVYDAPEIGERKMDKYWNGVGHKRRWVRLIAGFVWLWMSAGSALSAEQPETSAETEPVAAILEIFSNAVGGDDVTVLTWDGSILPGQTVRFYTDLPIATDMKRPAQTIIRHTGTPWLNDSNIVLQTTWRSVFKSPSAPSVLTFTLPKELPPGLFEVRWVLGEQAFGPFEFEIAEPESVELRRRAFESAKETAAGIKTELPLTGWFALHHPVPPSAALIDTETETPVFMPEAENIWAFAAEFADTDTGQSNRYIILTNDTGQVSDPILFHNSYEALAVWDNWDAMERLQYEGGGYNGWFWHPDGGVRKFPHVASCGEGDPCAEPKEADDPDIFIPDFPEPVSRLPEGADGPKPFSMPKPKTVYKPSEFYGEERLTSTCSNVKFSESVKTSSQKRNGFVLGQFSYQNYYSAVRTKPKLRDQFNPRIKSPMNYHNLPPQYGDIYFTVARSSPRMIYEVRPQAFMVVDKFQWQDQQIDDAIKKTIKWYARHCVFLTFHRVETPALKGKGAVITEYKKWLTSLTAPVGASISPEKKRNDGIKVLEKIQRAARVAANKRLKRKPTNSRALTVIFMDRLVGNVTHSSAQAARATESSMAIPFHNAVAMHGNDADDPYVLTHELIHALGRFPVVKPPPGPYSWFHSNVHDAMSNIRRRSSKKPSGLGFERLWDFAEYEDASRSGQLRRKR